MSTRGWAAAALPIMLLAMSAANAGDTASSGMKVAIDPATGKLRALTDEESAALDAASPRGIATKRLLVSESGTAPVQRPVRAGGFSMKVPQSAMTHVVATRDANGKLVIREVGATDDAAQPEATK